MEERSGEEEMEVVRGCERRGEQKKKKGQK
jgi:hypothetical protein